MGSGKSYLGKKLAAVLDTPFIDLDEYIEAGEGKRIGQLFEQADPTYFRKLEGKYLQQLAREYNNGVIATGGGTPCYFDHMERIKSMGYSIFLDVPIPVIVERLKAERAHRPLLSQLHPEELAPFLTDLYQQRLPHYQQADWTPTYPIHFAELLHELFLRLSNL